MIARLIVALVLFAASPALADSNANLDSVVQPYVDKGAFAGAILVVRDGAVLFDKAYGMADVVAGIANRPSTSFHIGTLSMQYTAVAIVALVESHKLNFDNTADQFVPGAPFVTVRDLLAVSPDDAKAAADYELLARIAEAATAKSFADVEDAAAFGSVWLTGTGLDDGSDLAQSRTAKGYVLDSGATNLAAADWNALAGAASAYTTTRDELHWLNRFFDDALVSKEARATMTAAPAGYGWFHGPRLGAESYWMAGRAPGFSSYVLRQPSTGLTVIVLANIGDAPAEAIGNGLAAGVLGHNATPADP